MRDIILHYHIFKNAGSTVDSILRRNFPQMAGSIEGEFAWGTLKSSDIVDYALANKNLCAISSHQARLPLPHHAGVQFHPLLFIRHPIDRLRSIYDFDRRQVDCSSNLPARMAKNNNLTGYLKWRLQHNKGAVVRNFQTIHIAAREFDTRTACANHQDLYTAKQRLLTLPCYGIVERFDESMKIITNYLNPIFGKLDTTHIIENHSNLRKLTLTERLHDVESELGNKFYAEVLNLNALDLELYRYANELFSRLSLQLSSTKP